MNFAFDLRMKSTRTTSVPHKKLKGTWKIIMSLFDLQN
jgi:hypothetical protein